MAAILSRPQCVKESVEQKGHVITLSALSSLEALKNNNVTAFNVSDMIIKL